MEKTIRIPGISCMHCLATIHRELEDFGVEVVHSELATKSVTIRWHATLSWLAIRDLLVEIGYPPEE